MNYHKNEVILRAKDISLTLGDRIVLQQINFEVFNIIRPGLQQGQVISLAGRSGIGKTQLLKIIAGLQQPSAGHIAIGADLHPVRKGEVGVVPQSYVLFNHRTVYENLRIGLRQAAGDRNMKQEKEMIHEYAEQFMLSGHLQQYPMQLSGGQRQRVSIIQQVLTGNRFILLDEPFSGLDLLMVDKVVDMLLRISTFHEHNTLIIVSHDLENSMAISDTVFIVGNVPGMQGATIKEKLDLVDMGLAWTPGIRRNKHFMDLVEDMKHKL